MKIKYYLFLDFVILAAIFTLGRCARRPQAVVPGGPKAAAIAALPVNDKEEVSFNEKTHTITVQTTKGAVKEYAKNPTVEIRKDGSVSISRHLVGLEFSPFMGAGIVLSGPRLFLGGDLFHIGRFDINASLGIPFNNQTGFLRPYAGLGYEVYDNTDVNLSVNPVGAALSKPDLALFVSLKF